MKKGILNAKDAKDAKGEGSLINHRGTEGTEKNGEGEGGQGENRGLTRMNADGKNHRGSRQDAGGPGAGFSTGVA